MATYKVIQDIEAEDKLVGPFSLRQFIYGLIVLACLFVAYQLARVQPLLAIPLLPPAVLFGFLAAPFGHDQSSEVWLLAKIRFALKPRRRIWDQAGVLDLVTVTAPKKVETHVGDGLNPYEVKSRLSALANTLDSRGWAVKNVNINMYGQPSYLAGYDNSDRLINPDTMPQNVPADPAAQYDDVLDEQTSFTAQHFQDMMNASTQAHKQQLVQQMQGSTAAATGQTAQVPTNDWFTGHQYARPAAPIVADQPLTTEEKQVLDKAHKNRGRTDPALSHMRSLKPKRTKAHNGGKKAAKQADKPVTPPPDPAIIQLANNDDLNVATIARQANLARPEANSSSDEVVISLR